jgi:G3E family GTPase
VVADQILITKTDLASAEQIAALTEQLLALNSVAAIHPIANGKIDREIFLEATTYHSPDKNTDAQRWQKPDAYRPIQIDPGLHMHLRRPAASSSNQHERIHSFCLMFEQPLPRRGLLTALQMLASMHGEHILRIKGIVHFDDNDKPHVIHGIQHMLFPIETLERWPQGLSGTQLVFIVEELTTDTITDMLKKFIGMDRGDRKAELTSWLIS